MYRPTPLEKTSRWIRRHRTLTAMTAVLVASLCAFGVNLFRLTMLEREDQLVRAIQNKVEHASGGLLAMQQYCSASSGMDRADYQGLAAPFLQHHRELQALEWVSQEGLNTRFLPNILAGLTPIPPADLPETMALARATGTATATCPLLHPAASKEAPRILVFCPLLESNTTREQQGGILGVYQVDTLLREAWHDISLAHLNVTVYDVTDPAAPCLLWSNTGGQDEPRSMQHIPSTRSIPFGLASRDFRVWNRTWKVITQAQPGFLWYYPLSR